MSVGLVACLSCAVLLVAAPADVVAQSNGTPRPGVRYDGTTDAGHRIYLRVGPAGDRINKLFFRGKAPCNRAAPFVGWTVRLTTQIGTDGSFERTAKEMVRVRLESGRRIVGSQTAEITGVFDSSGRTVGGSLRLTFTKRRLRCSGTVSWTAAADGTPGALYRNGSIATGRYLSLGPRPVLIRTFLPSRRVPFLRFRFAQSCSIGTTLRGRIRVWNIPMRGRRFTHRSRDLHRFRRGLRIRQRVEVSARFQERGGAYRVLGTLRVSATLSRHGRRITTCGERRTFIGTFAGGPENEASAVPSASQPATEVRRYTPFTPTGEVRPSLRIARRWSNGECIGGSINGRSDAWRCFAGDYVFDPCFESPTESFVLCPGFPGSRAHQLRDPELDRELRNKRKKGRIWAIRAGRDGRYRCRVSSGARSKVNGRYPSLWCNGASSAIWGKVDRRGKIWRALIGRYDRPDRWRWKPVKVAWR